VERTIQFLLSSYLSLKPFPRAFFFGETTGTRSRNFAASETDTRLPPLIPPPPPLAKRRTRHQKGKLPETRLSKNTASELCGHTILPSACTESGAPPLAVTLTELSFLERNRQIRGGLSSNPIAGIRASNFFVNRETFSSLTSSPPKLPSLTRYHNGAPGTGLTAGQVRQA
jgi:hypothetical protein